MLSIIRYRLLRSAVRVSKTRSQMPAWHQRLKPLMRRLPFAIALRQIAPVRTRAQHPKTTIDKYAVVRAAPTLIAGLAGQQRRNLRPFARRSIHNALQPSKLSVFNTVAYESAINGFGNPECRSGLRRRSRGRSNVDLCSTVPDQKPLRRHHFSANLCQLIALCEREGCSPAKRRLRDENRAMTGEPSPQKHRTPYKKVQGFQLATRATITRSLSMP